MKLIASISVVAAMAFASCGGSDTQDMTKFNKDLAQYMMTVTEKGGVVVPIVASCTPIENNKANCDVVIGEKKATAENVRREGDKFVWDHES